PATPDSVTILDRVAPTSSATSPQYSTSTTITVSYTASDDRSGLGSVELWAKAPGSSSFSQVATDSAPGATGSFGYSAAAGDGSYAFYTIAVDKAGNREVAPTGADTTTLLDTGAPLSNASSPAYTASTSISVSYNASDPGANASGLASVELWAKPAGAGSFSKVATDSSGSGSGTFTYTASAGDGDYAFYTIAV